MSQTFMIQNGDIVVSSSTGRPLMVADGQKLSQDLAEASGVRTQPNGFGFGIEDVIGLLGDAVSTRIEISRRIRDGISNMMRLQTIYQRAQRPNNELLAKLVRVVVTPLLRPTIGGAASTAYAFRFDVLTVAGLTPAGQPISQTGVIIPTS